MRHKHSPPDIPHNDRAQNSLLTPLVDLSVAQIVSVTALSPRFLRKSCLMR